MPSELLATIFDDETMPVIESEDDEAVDDPDEAVDHRFPTFFTLPPTFLS